MFTHHPAAGIQFFDVYGVCSGEMCIRYCHHNENEKNVGTFDRENIRIGFVICDLSPITIT